MKLLRTQQKVGVIIEAKLDRNKEEFDYESQKVLRFSGKSKLSGKNKVAPQPSNIICKIRIHCLGIYLFFQSRWIFLKPLTKTLISILTIMKYRSGLLHEVISNLSKNANGEIKFCCADSHRNSKIKFSDSKIISYDSIQLLRREYWERELTLES